MHTLHVKQADISRFEKVKYNGSDYRPEHSWHTLLK